MAHELDIQDGQAAMAYVGQKPWHGLGQELTEGADLETWKVQAGMNWEIKVSDVLYNVPGQSAPMIMPDRRLFYRSDNNSALSVVSGNFKIVQPGQTIEFYRDLVETAGFQLETAGCLFGGRKFWALAKAGSSIRIMGQDEIKPYLLLASACDGSMATCAHFTSVRVVCNNTLRMSIGSNGQKATVRVPHHAEFNPERVKVQLGIISEVWESFGENITLLAKTKLHRDDAIDLVAAELKAEWRAQGSSEDREERMQESLALRSIIRLFDGAAKGAEFKSANGTAWGLLNAVTEYYDHEAGSKTGDRSRAFERAHLTDHANLKVRMANSLLKIAA